MRYAFCAALVPYDCLGVVVFRVCKDTAGSVSGNLRWRGIWTEKLGSFVRFSGSFAEKRS